MNKNQKKIILIGPTPPIVGGISIFVKRFYNLLQVNYKVKLLRLKWHGSKKLLNKLDKLRLLVVFINNNASLALFSIYDRVFSFLFVTVAKIKGINFFYYLHSFRVEELSFIKKILFYFGLSLSDKIVVPGGLVKKKLLSVYPGLKKKSIIVAPTFIYPNNEELITKIPENIRKFIASHSPLLISNAPSIKLISSRDIYGIDNCIKITKDLKKDYPKIGFLFFLAEVREEKYFNKMNALINEYNISDNYIWVSNPALFLPVLKQTYLFLRPTLFDSYGISVAESLYLNIPVIASDVCERSSGCILYKADDYSDLIEKVANTLGNHKEIKKKIKVICIKDYSQEHLQIIKNALN